jgi:hypothetical protein
VDVESQAADEAAQSDFFFYRQKWKRQLAIFRSDKKYRRPVVVSNIWSLGFIPYKDKGIKLPDLLRRNRTHLPELLLARDAAFTHILGVCCRASGAARERRMRWNDCTKAELVSPPNETTLLYSPRVNTHHHEASP